MASRTAAVLGKVIRSVANADWSGVSDAELLRRFAAEKDQAAFAARVGRHSGMVLGVCRRALPNWQDAEDACQATFLVLAQKARGPRWRPSVAGWLYTTARKVAHNARVAARRRTVRECRAAVPEAVEPVDRMTGRELLAILDEELERLPSRYREPVVLCYLEGLTRDEAAAQLGVRAAPLHTQLARGRKRLADALTVRGYALPTALLALAVTSLAEASPPRLVESVLAAASGKPPAAVAALAKGVAVNGVWKKTMAAALVLVGVAALGVGPGSMALPAAGPLAQPAPAPDQDKPQAEKPKPDETGLTFTYSGRVLAPDGKPVAGARVFICGLEPGVIRFVPRTTTGADGTFRFTVRRDEFGDKGVVPPSRSPPERFVHIGVMADGYGTTADSAGQPNERENLTAWLPVEEVVKGRVVDLQGKPIAGVKV